MTGPMALPGSPVKHVDFQRGNSRVVSNISLSPRAMLKRRPGFTPQKYRAAQQQSRKPSNPIAKNKLDSLGAPKLDPPLGLSNGQNAEDDEWQDIEPQKQDGKPSTLLNGPDLKPESYSEAKTASKQSSSSFTRAESAKPKGQATTTPPFSQFDFSANDITTESNNSSSTTTATAATGANSNSNSFLGFSPSNMSASFLRKLGKHGRNFKHSASWRTHMPYGSSGLSEDPYSTKHYSSNHNDGTSVNQEHSWKSFWLDPSTPGLLALYLQVGFNLVMVGALLYAIAIFYHTIRNDVNLKVEEYSVDIVNEISQCSYEYLRNGCESENRVPLIEADCNKWWRCMQRDPKEVGRAKVSAETFGAIIEAFLRPIGIKSMIFLIGVFAGSFLLVNAVFSSRIGPRFTSDSMHSHHSFAPSAFAAMGPPPPPPPPPHAGATGAAAQQVSNLHSSYHPQVSYSPVPPAAHNSMLYSASPRASPRHRQPSQVHATLQSSPIHHHSQYPNYPY